MRNYIIPSIMLSCLCSGLLFAQSSGLNTPPLLRKGYDSGQLEQNIQAGPKYLRALKVYQNLVLAHGDHRVPAPDFVLRNEEKRVAQILYQDRQIILEEKAFDVCTSFGDDTDAALATLLSHELIHYYEKHAWRRGFVADYRDLPISLSLDSLHDDLTNETQADYLGGFLTYSAGYAFFNRSAELIERLYTAYGIPEQIDGYPSLSERKILSRRTTAKLERLVQVFEMANLLTAVGAYEEAYIYYKFVVQEYQSREINNNMGVVALLDALQYFDQQEKRFYLPVELDLETAVSRGAVDAVAKRTQLLKLAIQHFDAAISLDPNYAPAYLNKACAYFLLGDQQRARFYAEVEASACAERFSFTKTATDVKILLGILAAQGQDMACAQELFETAAKQGSELASLNLKVLCRQPITCFNQYKHQTSGLGQERICHQTMGDIAAAPTYDDQLSVTIQNGLYFRQDTGNDPASPLHNACLLISQQEKCNRLLLFLLTQPGYSDKTIRGIALGTHQAEIVTAYGPPQQTLETLRGQILVYPNILFIIGKEGMLEKWALYQL